MVCRGLPVLMVTNFSNSREITQRKYCAVKLYHVYIALVDELLNKYNAMKTFAYYCVVT